jgi:hypothetical protein
VSRPYSSETFYELVAKLNVQLRDQSGQFIDCHSK